MLYEVITISDTAEYGCYLFAHSCVPLLKDFMDKVGIEVIGKGLTLKDNSVDNQKLVAVNAAIRNHPIEKVGEELRATMQGMKAIFAQQ